MIGERKFVLLYVCEKEKKHTRSDCPLNINYNLKEPMYTKIRYRTPKDS